MRLGCHIRVPSDGGGESHIDVPYATRMRLGCRAAATILSSRWQPVCWFPVYGSNVLPPPPHPRRKAGSCGSRGVPVPSSFRVMHPTYSSESIIRVAHRELPSAAHPPRDPRECPVGALQPARPINLRVTQCRASSLCIIRLACSSPAGWHGSGSPSTDSTDIAPRRRNAAHKDR